MQQGDQGSFGRRTGVLAILLTGVLAISGGCGESDSGQVQASPSEAQAEATPANRPGPAGANRGRGDGLFEGLDLTESQRARVDEIVAEQRAARQAWREENADQFDDFRQRMRASFSSGDDSAREAMRAEREAMMASMPDYSDDIRDELTAEQRVIFDENLAQAEARRSEWRGRGMRPGGGGMRPGGGGGGGGGFGGGGRP